MMSFLRYSILISILSLCGCATHPGATYVAPGQTIKMTYVSYEVTTPATSTAPITTTPSNTADNTSSDAQNTDTPSLAGCPLYIPPPRGAIPPLPTFTQSEIQDPDQLNVKLSDYVLQLKSYIRNNIRLGEDAYTAYRQNCQKLLNPSKQ